MTENDIKIASEMITKGVMALVYFGGKEAAAETLDGIARRVLDGRYPEGPEAGVVGNA